MHKAMTSALFLTLLGTALSAGVNTAGNIVSDKQHAIYWQDSPAPRKSTKDWDDAVAYCDALTLKGRENWRLPSFEELLSIVDYTRHDPAINPVFDHVSEGTYWTAKDFSATKARAWTIDFRTGKTYYSYKTTNHAVRCVSDFTQTKDEK